MTRPPNQYPYPPPVYRPPAQGPIYKTVPQRRKGWAGRMMGSFLGLMLVIGAAVIIDYWPRICNQYGITVACPSPFPTLAGDYQVIATDPTVPFVDLAGQILRAIDYIPTNDRSRVAAFRDTAGKIVDQINKVNEFLDCGYTTKSFTVKIEQDRFNPWSIYIGFAVRGSYAQAMLNVGRCFLIQQVRDFSGAAFVRSPVQEPIAQNQPRPADCADAIDESLGQNADYTLVWLGSSDQVCASTPGPSNLPPPPQSQSPPPDGGGSVGASPSLTCHLGEPTSVPSGYVATIKANSVNVRFPPPATRDDLNNGTSPVILTVGCGAAGVLVCYTIAADVPRDDGGGTDNVWDHIAFPAGTVDDKGNPIPEWEDGYVSDQFVDTGTGTDVTTLVPHCSQVGLGA